MKRFLGSVTLLILFTQLISFSPSPEGMVDDVLNYTNKFRKSKGLPALTLNTDLNAIAQKHSENMAKGKVGFGHSGFNTRYAMAKKKINGFSGFAENVAYGVSTGKDVVSMWKNSSDHRRNMLGSYTYIGIGIARDKRGQIYYTQVFAR